MEDETKIIKEKIGETYFDAESDCEPTAISTVIQWFTDMQKAGANFVEWYAKTDYDGCSDSVEVEAIRSRLETQEEFNQRMESEKKKIALNRKMQIEQERMEYERLKKKFEPKNNL